MQNVATGKAELAALPLSFSSESSAVQEDFSVFRSLLKDASEKELTQPLESRVPETIGDSKFSDTDSTINAVPVNLATASSEEMVDEGASQIDTIQSDDKSLGLLNESAENVSVQFVVAEEFDSAIPLIDILDLLEQSQFKQITITPGQKVAIEDQLKQFQGLVEHLKTLREQSDSLTEVGNGNNTKAMNSLLNNFITVLEQQIIEPESSSELTKLLSKFQSEIEPEKNTQLLPAPDIELLSIVFADDNSSSETADIVEELAVNVKQQIVQFADDSVASSSSDSSDKEIVQSPIKSESPITSESPNQTETDALFVAEIESLVKPETESLVEPETKSLVEPETESLVKPDVELVTTNTTEIENPNVIIQPNEIKVLNQPAEPKDIKQLLALSPEKLDKALENLANRVVQTDTINSQEIETQTKTPNTIKQEFIASLKASFDEIKSQIKQGKLIDSDLKGLVVDGLKQISQELNPQSVSATVSRFSQTLELSSTLMAHTSANSANGSDASITTATIDRVLTKENQSQSNLLQVQQGKQQIVQFEKAVNIMRTEGHHQLVEKVRWMVNQNNLQADIRLDPPDLGAMKVRVSLSGDTANVNIVVQSQQAKDLLDSAAPRLRDLLEQQGIQLGQSSVEQDQRQKQHNGAAATADNSELASESEPDVSNLVTEQTIINGQLSGIDYFV